MTVPGAHGGDGHRVAAALGVDPSSVLDLSASLNPVAPDVGPILRDAVDRLDVYPDDERATAALAEAIGVDRSRLVLTNGGAEAIALVAAEYPVGWAEECEFSLYRRHLAILDPDGPRWCSDPHNPTGALVPSTESTRVRDEAFYLLATGRWTRGDVGCTVVGSLTKAWAVPGLRVGYVLGADADEAAALRARRPRWSVNGLVAAALPDLLAVAEPERWQRQIADLRADLVAVLATHDLTPVASDVNYVWIPEAAGLREQLLAERIVVRDGTSFGHPDAVRIAVPDPEGLSRLTTALDRVEGTRRPRPPQPPRPRPRPGP